jgi:periplasmic divalent cation tolerance protein
MQKFSDGVVLYTTWPDKMAAEICARTLIAERLAACANILGGVTSVYRWQNQVETADEFVMIVKTTKQAAAQAVARIGALHPYDVPVIAELPLGDASAGPFLDWLRESVDDKS